MMDERSVPDAACILVGARLTALLDDELPLPERRAIALHLKACARCNAELELERTARAALRSAGATIQAPAHIYRDLRTALALASGRRPFWSRALPLAGLAAAFVLVAAVALLGSAIRQTPNRQLIERVVRAHQQETLSRAPVQFASNDRAAVGAWLRTQGREEIDVPDFSAYGFQLAGVRLDPAIGPRAVTFVYAGADGAVTCTVVPATLPGWLTAPLDGLRPGTRVTSVAQTELVSWGARDGMYILAGNLQPAELVLLARTAAAPDTDQ